MAFFKYGELPLVLLALLESRPMNGHELLACIAERYQPHYVPSPGSIYPAIAALERESLIKAAMAKKQKVYSLTRHGVQALEQRRDKLASIELRTGVPLGRDPDLETEIELLRAAIEAAAAKLGAAIVRTLVVEARVSIQKRVKDGARR